VSGGRTLLGTTAGASLFVLSGSILVWPAADLFLGPKLIEAGMKAEPARKRSAQASYETQIATSHVFEEDTSLEPASVTMVSGAPGLGRLLESDAAQAGRPTVYVTLREATSPHDLYFSMLAGVYASERLGFVGTLAHSMGVWWIVLFDIMVGHEPEKTRAFNFSVILQHLKRALLTVHTKKLSAASRPLVILDNLPTAQLCNDTTAMQPMLMHLVAWCTCTSYDEGLADIIIVNQSLPSRWRPSSNDRINRLKNATDFQECFKKQWSP
jgi:hypothetical protein